MTVTIKDIAKAAGVSYSTVSRALNGHPAISAKTSEKVEKLAIQMGYVPSAAARGLKTNRSYLIGVIVNRLDNPFYSKILRGIEDTLYNVDYSFFVASSNRDTHREQQVIQTMAERRVDGLIITDARMNLERLQQLNQFGIPLVLINNRDTLDRSNSYLVHHDDIYGMKAVVRHLIELGHRRISYLGSSRSGKFNEMRYHGYETALREADIPLCDEYVAHVEGGMSKYGLEGSQALLALPEPPTAIVCYNDLLAIGVMQAVQEAGLQIPTDISITGFDNIEFASYTTPSLTTFHQPGYELGREAVKMLLDILAQPTNSSNGSKALTLRGQFIARKSTASPLN